jgi:YD repeat-containing protein
MEKKQISKKYQYDPLNRLVSVTEKDGCTQVYTYDPGGNRTMTTILESRRAPPASLKTGPEAPIPPSPAAQQLCGNCSNPVKPGKRFCSNCGAPVNTPAQPAPAAAVSQQSPVCTTCGNPIKPGAKFCGKCGRKLT